MISIIILAAGESRRFGRNKLLIPISGVPMIRRIVMAALNSMVSEVVVVLGFEAELVRKVIEDLPCKIVVNENYSLGMSSSVKVGFKAVSRDVDAVIVLPGDYPLIDSDVINMVVKVYRETGAPIVIASYRGRRGHPVLFSSTLFSELMEINEETMGLKSILRRHEREIVLAETGKIGVVLDVDVPEDFNRVLKIVNS
ncbi:MAG: nucleotidyltransferase family protein [archaeon GB-1867-035]|nr:nucleotidyltransferase family protein [Candidatus Culexmicrobium profundum]